MKELKKGFMISIIGVLLCCTTGCWDKNELNQLAIGELVGADQDPDTGKQIVYYQIVNPDAVAIQKGGGIKAPVYTYRVEADHISELGAKTSNLLPRKLFSDHYQSEIVTERYARQGIISLLNFFEKQHNRRSNIYLFITDSPLSDVMMTYLPLERLPGRSLRSIIEIQSQITGRLSKRVRVKDLVENMESSKLTVLPMISLNGPGPSPSTSRYEHISGNQGNLHFSGGAILKHDRMIGKLKLDQMDYYFILKGDSKVFMESLTIHNHKVAIRAVKPKVWSHLDIVSGEPVWKVDIRTKLMIVNNEQKEDLTLANLDIIKETFKQQVFQKMNEFYQESVRQGWDLFGLEEKIKYQNGKEWDLIKKKENILGKTKLQLSIQCEITDIGQIINPYTGENDGNSSN
ncbi:Ger(x)C family spore germination protein [Thermoactinomyces sp. DSM 45892]|uniref:Ger(x)C family spore germination protein n=1 Tax=Thermoactinomyces sp. DSM 45892 TaxID=1882753 RepID=UPI00089A1EF0|nr:Ger(x)C family spore germination protein [Thermoactinomyces sp. DSM 45892]SDZ23210.1 spore germination protein KC [Thermoactinomyces sp. DSM 45892]